MAYIISSGHYSALFYNLPHFTQLILQTYPLNFEIGLVQFFDVFVNSFPAFFFFIYISLTRRSIYPSIYGFFFLNTSPATGRFLHISIFILRTFPPFPIYTFHLSLALSFLFLPSAFYWVFFSAFFNAFERENPVLIPRSHVHKSVSHCI